MRFQMARETENYNKLIRFFDAEYQALKAFVSSRVDDSAERDAEDIVQDVALKLFSRADHLSPIENIAGFVYRSIRNQIIDTMRTSKQRVDLDARMEESVAELAELFYGDAAYASAEELKAILKEAIAGLKPEYREVIMAIDFDNMSYRQLSMVSGIPQGTLMSRRHRAISILLKELETKRNKLEKNGKYAG